MQTVWTVILMVAVVALWKDIKETLADLPKFLKRTKKAPKPAKPTYESVTSTLTEEEEEAQLCALLESQVPSRKKLMALLMNIRNTHLHKGHSLLFRRLLYYEKLSPKEIAEIQERYKYLSPKHASDLDDCLIDNQLIVRPQSRFALFGQ
jgi:hypothetical protein